MTWFKRLFGIIDQPPEDTRTKFLRQQAELDALAKTLKLEEKLDESETRRAFLEYQESIETPWACFEIAGFKEDGQIKVEFHWNAAFIETLDQLGFTAESEEDTVQLFFYASQMKPTELSGGDDPVQSADLPGLSSNSNRSK